MNGFSKNGARGVEQVANARKEKRHESDFYERVIDSM
jgi:hypothetical protein